MTCYCIGCARWHDNVDPHDGTIKILPKNLWAVFVCIPCRIRLVPFILAASQEKDSCLVLMEPVEYLHHCAFVERRSRMAVFN